MSGLVLNRHEVDYVDLTTIGTVTIQPDGAGGIKILVDGFEFGHADSCRETVTKALAWARDVLNTEVQANRLIPGGHLTAIAGTAEEAGE